jgi:hypothetical protein
MYLLSAPFRLVGFVLGNVIVGGLRAVGHAVIFLVVMLGFPMLINRYGWPF